MFISVVISFSVPADKYPSPFNNIIFIIIVISNLNLVLIQVIHVCIAICTETQNKVKDNVVRDGQLE